LGILPQTFLPALTERGSGFSLKAMVAMASRHLQAHHRAAISTGLAALVMQAPGPLPSNAVFEAVLIDTAIADAPARELGRVRLQPSGQPPFRFTIPYRDADVTPAGRFTVRATVRWGEGTLGTKASVI